MLEQDTPSGFRTLNGRHGDIKPENILQFPGNGLGVLKLADFSETRFFTDSHSRVTNEIGTTRDYCAPEYESNMAMSTSWGVWALGCIYLEFLIWFYSGQEEVDDFTKERLSPDPRQHPYFNTATFYRIRVDIREINHAVKQVSCLL